MRFGILLLCGKLPCLHLGDKMMEKKGKPLGRENLLDMIPKRTCRWYVERGSGRCVIRKKRFPSGPSPYQRFFMRLLKRDEYVRIRLDDYGDAVFRLMDGERDVRTVGAELRERFGEEVEPVYPRLSSYLLNMESNGIIELERKGRG